MATVAEYLAAQGPDNRKALDRLRKLILAAAPGAQERISYGIIGFRRDDRFFLYIGATAKHCAIYAIPKSLAPELTAYDTSGKGTLRFKCGHPPPAALVRKIVKAAVTR